MTEAELIEWGAVEDERRSAEIEAAGTDANKLDQAQCNGRVRRAEIGLNASQATRWVVAGRRSRMGLPSL